MNCSRLQFFLEIGIVWAGLGMGFSGPGLTVGLQGGAWAGRLGSAGAADTRLQTLVRLIPDAPLVINAQSMPSCGTTWPWWKVIPVTDSSLGTSAQWQTS